MLRNATLDYTKTTNDAMNDDIPERVYGMCKMVHVYAERYKMRWETRSVELWGGWMNKGMRMKDNEMKGGDTNDAPK